MNSQIRILIANRYFLMNFAIKCILQKIKGFDVYGADESEILPSIKKIKPEILILEIEVLKQDSFQLLSEIKTLYPKLKILVLLDIENKQKLVKILKIELNGYLLKNTSREELIAATIAIHRGERYYSREINNYVIDSITKPELEKSNIKAENKLSCREKEILNEIISGKNNREIADVLFISEHTVLTHRRNIMRKLKVKSTPQLIIKSFKHGYVSLQD